MPSFGSKLLTVAAGVLAAIFCYTLIARVADYAGLVQGDASLMAVDLTSANVGAVAAALLVALWPADRAGSIVEAFTTWALSTIVLMFMVAPHAAAPHHETFLQAAR